ncbi:hypothetical protein [Natrinema salaciae]|uniref:hypothetical protein n=1 Tax=Natrinema salaciae TaxID=1186196 RepID=UPI001113A7B7|nr:hypothetical protein [Natrinema salaciae]
MDIHNKIRFPEVIGSVVILVGVILTYDQSHPIAYKLISLSLIIVSFLIALEGVEIYQASLAIGIPVLIAGGLIIYDDTLPPLYGIVTIVIAISALILYSKLPRDS